MPFAIAMVATLAVVSAPPCASCASKVHPTSLSKHAHALSHVLCPRPCLDKSWVVAGGARLREAASGCSDTGVANRLSLLLLLPRS